MASRLSKAGIYWLLLLFMVPLCLLVGNFYVQLSQQKSELNGSLIASKIQNPLAHIPAKLIQLHGYYHLYQDNGIANKLLDAEGAILKHSIHIDLEAINAVFDSLDDHSLLQKEWRNAEQQIKRLLTLPNSDIQAHDKGLNTTIAEVEYFKEMVSGYYPTDLIHEDGHFINVIKHQLPAMISKMATSIHLLLEYGQQANSSLAFQHISNYIQEAELHLIIIERAFEQLPSTDQVANSQTEFIVTQIRLGFDELAKGLTAASQAALLQEDIIPLMQQLDALGHHCHTVHDYALDIQHSILETKVNSLNKQITGLWLLGAFLLLSALLVVRFIVQTLAQNRNRSNMHQAIMDTAMEGIVVIDNKGLITMLNPAAEHIFGYSQDEAKGQDISIFMPKSKREDHKKIIANLTPASTPDVIGRSQIRLIAEHKLGQPFHIELSLNEMKLDDAIYYLGTVRNIDLEVKAQQERDDANLHYKTLINTVVDAILTFDKDGQITSFNHTCELVFNRAAESVLGTNINQLVPDLITKIATATADGFEIETGDVEEELTAITRHGQHFPIHLGIGRMELAGRTEYVCAIRDISEWKQSQQELKDRAKELEHTAFNLLKTKQEAEKANRHKSNFLATMSHEIRTPMNGIVGLTDLLLNTHIDNKQKQHLNTIQKSAESLVHIINDILDLSKIEAGQLHLVEENNDLRATCEELADLLSVGTNSDVELLLYVDPAIPKSLQFDRIRLRQVLLNLINNAIKFTHQGWIFLSIELLEHNQNHCSLEVKVTDTGIGIPDAAKEIILDPFIQADSSTTRTYGGTGLGLSIAKQLLKLMHSEIELTSKVNEGSCFSFKLDFSLDSKSQNIIYALPEHTSKKAIVATRYKQLEPVWKNYLTAAGWDCECLVGETEISARLEHDTTPIKADILIVDCLNKKSTIESGKWIKSLWPQASELPPMIATARLSKDKEKSAEWWDTFAGEIHKPIHLQAFIHFLNQFDEAGFVTQDTTSNHSNIEQIVKADKALEKLHILLAEDNEANIAYMSSLFDHLAVNADIVENGLLAFTKYQDSPDHYDLILMDVNMPVMNGIKATELIREYEHNLFIKPIPIIALTANVLPDQLARCIQAGMNSTLTKPVRMGTIKDTLMSIANRHDDMGLMAIKPESNERADKTISPIKPSAPESDIETLNEDDFEVFLSVTQDRAEEMLDVFMGKIRSTLDDIEITVQQGDRENLKLYAHTIKSNAAQFGALKLSKLLAKLEASAKAEDWGVIKQLMAQNVEEFQILRNTIEEQKKHKFASPD